MLLMVMVGSQIEGVQMGAVWRVQSAYHLAKTGSFPSSSRHLDSNRTRFVYVGEGDRRETLVSCFSPSLHSHLLFSSLLPCHYLSFLYLPTLAVSFSER